LQTESIYSI